MLFSIYSRKSKFTGKGESIENQIEMCKHYIFSHFPEAGEEDIMIYEDEGYSAKDLNRPEFKKLLLDTHKQKPDYIVCYRLDRISRNVSDFSSLIEDLNSRKIAFICIKEQFDTSTPMGRAMMYIASVFAQLERETLTERVRDNMLMLARTGRWLGGSTPTGFDSEKVEQMVVDGKIKTSCKLKYNTEIQTVKIIYNKFLELYSLAGVSKYLRNKNIKSRYNRYYTVQSIKQILTNPVYCTADEDAYYYFSDHGSDVCFTLEQCSNGYGLLAYGKRETKGNNEILVDEAGWIVAIGKHSGLVSGKEWIAVQNRLADNKPAHKAVKSHNNYSLLSGILCCEKCGAKMFTKIRYNRGRKDMFDYICDSKLKGNISCCNCPNLNGQLTDDVVCDDLKNYMDENTNIYKMLENLKRKYRNNSADGKKDEFSPLIIKCQSEIDNLISSLASATISESLLSRIDKRISELENQLKIYKSEQKKENYKYSVPVKSAKQVEETVAKLSCFKKTFDYLTVQEKRELLKRLVEKIEWDGDTLYIL